MRLPISGAPMQMPPTVQCAGGCVTRLLSSGCAHSSVRPAADVSRILLPRPPPGNKHHVVSTAWSGVARQCGHSSCLATALGLASGSNPPPPTCPQPQVPLQRPVPPASGQLSIHRKRASNFCRLLALRLGERAALAKHASCFSWARRACKALSLQAVHAASSNCLRFCQLSLSCCYQHGATWPPCSAAASW